MKTGSKVKSYCLDNIVSIISLWENFSSFKASNSKENTLIWLEIKLIRDFIAVLVTCKFEEHPIKNKDAIDRPRSTMGK